MKKVGILFTLLALVFAFNASAQESLPGATIIFKEKAIDFGTISQGEKVSHTFEFKNSGSTPLIISNVAVTCGCTATNWPKDPIAPGNSSKITVSFDSTNKMGTQNSVVRIYSNASEPIEKVSLISNVVPNTTH
jgi:hypothetical protein